MSSCTASVYIKLEKQGHEFCVLLCEHTVDKLTAAINYRVLLNGVINAISYSPYHKMAQLTEENNLTSRSNTQLTE